MGAYLSSPKIEKTSLDMNYPHIEYGVSGMQGWRISMEVTDSFMFMIKCSLYRQTCNNVFRYAFPVTYAVFFSKFSSQSNKKITCF